MKALVFTLFFSINLLNTFSSFSQTKISIYNEDKEVLPYVNVSMKNEQIGLHSNENGEIAFDERLLNNHFVLSKVGYRDTTVMINSQLESIEMKKASIYEDEYQDKNGKRVVKIGKIKGENFNVLSNSGKPQITLEYFPGDQYGYHLDQFSFRTQNEIDNAKVNIRFYAANNEMEPEEYLYAKDVIVDVKKGKRLNKIDLSEFNLRMPKNGLFIGFEVLIIPENIFSYDQKDLKTEKMSRKIEYMPKFEIYKYQGESNKLFPSYVFTGGQFFDVKGNKMSVYMQLKLKRP